MPTPRHTLIPAPTTPAGPAPVKGSPLKLAAALALGALGIGLLIKALFFPTDPLTPGMVERMNRAPAAHSSP